jgi:hypothetical protein
MRSVEMTGLRLCASQCVCCLWLATLVGVAHGQVRGQPPTVPPPRDFAEFLVRRDLVVEGWLLSAEAVTRKPLGGCGVTGLGPYPSLDLRIAVERVRYGTADDSTVIISTVGRPQFPAGLLSPGARVIAWAFRDCHDGWRLWGRLCVVSGTGSVVGELGQEEFYRLQGQSGPLRHGALDSALTQREENQHSSSNFVGASNVALLRLTRTARNGGGGFTYECDSVAWALGTGDRVPRSIDFPRLPGCYPEIFPGDSLLVPLPAGFSGDRLTLNSCPRSLKVKNRFAVVLGVPLEFLNHALRAEPSGLNVRAYISKE